MSSVAIGSATTLLEEAHAGNDDTALLGNALIEASCCGRFDVVRRLLAHPLVDVRASWFGPSPPFWNADSHPSALRGAALGGHCQCVDLLLQHPNADPTAFDNEAIRFACENGHAGIVELLLAIPDVRDTVNPNHLLSLACRGSHSDVIRVLLDQVDIDLGADGFLALLHVCERGNDRVARQLLARCKGDPRLGEALLQGIPMVAKSGNVRLMGLLMDYVDMSEVGNIALIEACKAQTNTPMVRFLLGLPTVNVSAFGHSALRTASTLGHRDIVRCLLRYAPVSSSGAADESILIETLAFEKYATARDLLWCGGWVAEGRMPSLIATLDASSASSAGRRARRSLRSAVALLRRQREHVTRVTMLLNSLPLPGEILEFIAVLAYGDLLNGPSTASKLKDAARLRRLARPRSK
ncbi:Ankyrin repeat domain-containing protein [Plasmodiophora brassicae]